MQTINIGLRIRSLRKKKGLTQEGLASALSVSPQAVSKWESGAALPDIMILPTLADFFGISIDELMGYKLNALTYKEQFVIKNLCDTQQRFNLGIVGVLELINKHKLLGVFIFLEFSNSAFAFRIVDKAIEHRHHGTKVDFVILKEFLEVFTLDGRDYTRKKLMQFSVRFIIQKGSKILGFNSSDVYALVVKFSNEIKDAVTDSINRHTELVCIVFALLHFLLMDIGIKQIGDLLTAIKLAGCNTQVDSIAKRSAHLSNKVLGVRMNRADLHVVNPRDHLQIIGV